MADAILFVLPEAPATAPLETSWWHVGDGQVIDRGSSSKWVELAAGSRRDGHKRIGLAPAAAVRLHFSERVEAASERQALSAANIAAVESSLGHAEALHAATAASGDELVTAVVDKQQMLGWIQWARAAAVELDHVVPMSCLLPLSDQWTAARFGTEQVVGKRGMVMPFERDLVSHVVGDAEPRELTGEEVDAALVACAEQPPLDLRSGKMARRRKLYVDRVRVRELAAIAAAIPLIFLVSLIIGIVKLNAATNSLDEETVAVASRISGRPVPLEAAESELSQRSGGAGHSVMAPLTGLYSALEAEESVSSTELSYRGDGTLSATLAAATLDPINRVLIAVQRDGYKITAVPRQAPDGRSMIDVTVRSAP
jgi:general secretion pathway protein L